mmetsp:Transcript_512/g.1227  ORF Transcript_512/g.1227 Transcript_512/m.1227 type:complete len:452 (-) Transcript_512:192-1547(-)|eukprot:CAMPEP_0206477690 /NCGR_PEP_ID=MMETSP0324_2-20121206/35569_1 /ASSEMBLY_ACC=CAM_ASM_000836 /TAXON_ID=2866 /ORGANISM="Crypthecodinium cohnii, Strain Seligo" /LENGTH=451 /DNA_ID=CAMNT_0053953775 /DNA_START=55 /DNA_END=1410 /DNA_ORIENTATION=-
MAKTTWTDFGAEVQAQELGVDGNGCKRIENQIASWVEKGVMPMGSVLLARNGKIVHYGGCGEQAPGKPIKEDTIYRIYSMTKPVTAVAAMMLVEEGLLHLGMPVHQVLGKAWAKENMKVVQGGTSEEPSYTECQQDITISHLLTHTSGLTYGFAGMEKINPACALYQERMGTIAQGSLTCESALQSMQDFGILGPQANLKMQVEELASLPLSFQPGEKWHYGMNVEALGRVVEVVSGKTLGEFFEERIFAPLGMSDTAFFVPKSKLDRFAAVRYSCLAGGSADITDVLAAAGEYVEGKVRVESGGGGLVSTSMDYFRFAQCLMNGGIGNNGVRILARRTVEYMITNHLPNNSDMESMALPGYTEIFAKGTGFGLGLSVVLDPVPAQDSKSKGTFGWGGLAGTVFFCDPVEQTCCVFMTQNIGINKVQCPYRVLLSNLVAGCLIDGPAKSQV